MQNEGSEAGCTKAKEQSASYGWACTRHPTPAAQPAHVLSFPSTSIRARIWT